MRNRRISITMNRVMWPFSPEYAKKWENLNSGLEFLRNRFVFGARHPIVYFIVRLLWRGSIWSFLRTSSSVDELRCRVKERVLSAFYFPKSQSEMKLSDFYSPDLQTPSTWLYRVCIVALSEFIKNHINIKMYMNLFIDSTS
jgi:hypothetical protein